MGSLALASQMASASSGQFITIENTTIDVDTGNSSAYGVKSYQRPVVLQDCFVVSSGKGVYGAGHQVVGSTVDATGYAVELWSGSLVENSILVQSTPVEARADTFRYSILPDLDEIERWNVTQWVSNNDTTGVSEEDPFSIIVSDHYLLLDSFAMPDNNPSGQQIGYYPGKYIESVIARDVTVQQAEVTITDDAELPDSLAIDASFSGAITFNVLDNASLIVYGNIDLQGTAGNLITFQSDNASPSTGDWDGLAFRDDAVVDMQHVKILHAGEGGGCPNNCVTGYDVYYLERRTSWPRDGRRIRLTSCSPT